MGKQGVQVIFGPSVIKTLSGHLLRLLIQVGQILHQDQGIGALIHANAVDYFWICGMIFQGNPVLGHKILGVGILDLSVELVIGM